MAKRIRALYGSGSAYVKENWHNFRSEDENNPTSGGGKRVRRNLKRRQKRIDAEQEKKDE